MSGLSVCAALAISLLGAEPLWPDLGNLPSPAGGGEKDAAVVVAVEDYAYLPDVVGASDLGVAWFMYLKKVLDVPLVMLLQDGDATPIKIRNAVEQAASRVQPGGRVWFVFIGHGAPTADGQDGAMVGATAQADQYDFYPHTVARGELLEIIGKGKPVGGLPPVLVVDACFSGTDVSGNTLIKGAQFAVSRELAVDNSATFLTAGRAKDIAGQLPGVSRPAFSYLVLGALRGWGDLNRDGAVTASEAVQYAQDVLMTLDSGRQQRPQHGGDDQKLVILGGGGEAGPDLTDIKLRLTGSDSGTLMVKDEFKMQLAELEKARRERVEAERREAALLEVARQRHENEVNETWAQVRMVAEGGGPEGKRALELFLQRYQGHTFGNPREAQAVELLARITDAAATALKGFVLIEPGCFTMGSPVTEKGRYESEIQHEVCLSRKYFMKETLVTQGEWKSIMGFNPSYFVACGDACPVEKVSWWDALAFCNAWSRKEGLQECYSLSGCTGKLGGDFQCTGASFAGLGCTGYRLPTEAEWEYAVRAGTKTATYVGDPVIVGERNAPMVDIIAWYSGNSGVSYANGSPCGNWAEKQYSSSYCGTHPVKKKKPNAWGLYDMLGNVWEWCWDIYEPNYYKASPKYDPLGPVTGKLRSVRGGTWDKNPWMFRSAFRYGYDPAGRFSDMGLRVARTVGAGRGR